MAADARSQVHEKGLRLAEEGRHAEALAHIREHLRHHPNDHQALNDIGVILFCMGANDEAIDHLEKAKACCPDAEATEVNWNLCEAYLGAGCPGPAMKLFDEMERQEILSPDLLNRGANAFLVQDMYGHAIELLIRSLAMAPSQEILKPMIEVIRSRRPKVGVFAAERNEATQRLFAFVGQRFTAALHTGAGRDEIRSLLDQCDIAFFDGCWDTLIDVSYLPARRRFVVRLSDEDVYKQSLGNICWRNVDSVILTDNPVARERLLERFGDLDAQVQVVATGRGVDAKRFGFADKARGKRIACLDDLTLKHNPMFLLQVMQKLHYIDRDYRLYFAGEFEDGATEDYIRHMVEALELSNEVFFDGAIRNKAAWLRDKHYVVTAAVCADGLGGVLEGMSCGLKPVVHNFPGAPRMFDAEFLFNISEEFCNQILSPAYEPRRYRQIVETRYSEAGRFRAITDVLFRLEKGVVKEAAATAASPEALPEAFGVTGPSTEMGGFEARASEPAPAFGVAGPLRGLKPSRLGPVEADSAAMRPFEAITDAPVVEEMPQIAWSGHANAPRQTAAQHLCDRVGSINQMSADVLRDWKTFADGCGGASSGPIKSTELSEDMQPVEIVSPNMDGPLANGGLRITGLAARRRSASAPAEVNHVPFV
jgi:glycosyltransferase involved in cell wall biosynthesis